MVRLSTLATLAIASLASGAPTVTSSVEVSPDSVSGLDAASTAPTTIPTTHDPIEFNGVDPVDPGSLVSTSPMSNTSEIIPDLGAIDTAIDWPMYPGKVGAGFLIAGSHANNPADDTQNFGFYGNVKPGYPAYYSWKKVSGDTFGFYQTHLAPNEIQSGYLHHEESDLCVTLVPTSDTHPMYRNSEMTLAPCDTDRPHPPPSQTFVVQYTTALADHFVHCITAYNEGEPKGLERFEDTDETIHVARLGDGAYDNCILLIAVAEYDF